MDQELNFDLYVYIYIYLSHFSFDSDLSFRFQIPIFLSRERKKKPQIKDVRWFRSSSSSSSSSSSFMGTQARRHAGLCSDVTSSVAVYSVFISMFYIHVCVWCVCDVCDTR